MTLITRQDKGSKLTIQEMDGNLTYLEALNNAEEIVYADLYDKIVAAQLTPGQWYKLTDYKSVNFLNGWNIAYINPTATDPNFDPREIYEGENEALLLQATTTNALSPVAYSEKYPQDILEFQAYTNKIGVDLDFAAGDLLPNGSFVPNDFDLKWDGTNVYIEMPTGFPALFGHYFYLYAEFSDGENSYYQDGTYEPLTPGIVECQYPYTSDDPDYGYPKAMSRIRVEEGGMKVVLLDLTEEDFNNYAVNSLYIDTVQAIGDAYGWVTRRNNTQKQINVPFDFRGRKYRRFEVDLSAINVDLGTGYYGIGDNFLNQGTTGNYKDLKIFFDDIDTYNIQWEGIGGPDVYWYNGFSDNNVFGSRCENNSIEDYMFNNTVGFFFVENKIKKYFANNTIGDFTFGNTVGVNFTSNKIASSFSLNTIASYFGSNIIANNFNNNKIDYASFGTNFSSATHVYAGYNCQIFLRSNFTFQLSYIDGTNTVQYAAITA
jgi:hypothetical protein